MMLMTMITGMDSNLYQIKDCQLGSISQNSLESFVCRYNNNNIADKHREHTYLHQENPSASNILYMVIFNLAHKPPDSTCQSCMEESEVQALSPPLSSLRLKHIGSLTFGEAGDSLN